MPAINDGNGSMVTLKQDWRDHLKTIGIVLGTIAVAVPFLFYIFMPRLEATETHNKAERERQANSAALVRMDKAADKTEQRIEKQFDGITKTLEKIDRGLEDVQREQRRLRREFE